MALLNSYKKIIIRTPNWLGDLMISTAFVRSVLQAFPDSRVDLIVKSGFESIPLHHRGTLLPYDKSKQDARAFGKTLRDEEYDLAFVLPPSLSSAVMMSAAKIKPRVGHKGSLRNFFLKPSVAYSQQHRTRHLAEEFHELLEYVTELKTEICPPGLDINEEWIQSRVKTLKIKLPDKYTLFAPGAIYGPAKQWPIGHFKALAQKLKARGSNVVVMGTSKDYDSGEIICEGNSNCQNLCGQTSLNELIALMARSDLLISNDSGAMHVMAALQKPQIAIFGSTSSVWTGPLNQKAELVQIPIECSPCFSRTCKFDHYNCLHQVSPEVVLKKFESLQSYI